MDQEFEFENEVMETGEEYRGNKKDDSLSFEIIEHIGVVRANPGGWARELNIVAWNGGKAKYDIRDWAPDHTRMLKGITLYEEDMQTLCKLYADREKKN